MNCFLTPVILWLEHFHFKKIVKLGFSFFGELCLFVCLFLFNLFWLHWVFIAGSSLRHTGSLVVAYMWDLVPWPGTKPRPPALGAWSLTHWTTGEVPKLGFFSSASSKSPYKNFFPPKIQHKNWKPVTCLFFCAANSCLPRFPITICTLFPVHCPSFSMPHHLYWRLVSLLPADCLPVPLSICCHGTLKVPWPANQFCLPLAFWISSTSASFPNIFPFSWPKYYKQFYLMFIY